CDERRMLSRPDLKQQELDMASYRNAIIPTLCLTAALVLFGSAQAADSGFYVGGSIGQSTLKVPSDVTDVPDFSEDDTGYKLFAGYNWNLALFNLGVEGGYIDFGSPSGALDADTSLKIDADGLNLVGLGGLNFGPFDIYAKAGWVSWDASLSIGGVDPGFGLGSLSEDGTDLMYGLGARFALGKLHIRGEWEEFDIEDSDRVYMFSLGVAWQF
ncbi:MAG: porin family protein, partial [Gammaproteobacteria bacterium]|nr:porin family protein [Gammaproteobacteria bacterium]